MSIYCQACNNEHDGVKGSPLTEHTCKGMEPLFRPNWVSKPGSTIADFLKEREVSIQAFAEAMQMSLQEAIELLLAIRPITIEIATKLEAFTGASLEFWLNREKLYREGLAIGLHDRFTPCITTTT